MNISPKYSSADLAGVAGLIAFLADPGACAARLEELKAEGAKAYAAASEVQARINAEAELAKVAEAEMAAAQAEKARLEAVAARMLEERTALDTREAALRIREATLDAAQADNEKFRETLDATALALGQREGSLARAEEALAADRAAHEEKVKKLRELAG